MNYNLSKENEKPQYMQLYEMLVQDIVSGVYEYGSKLLSKRVIAEETGVSVITVNHALSLLNDEGYIESRERSGNFVSFKKDDFLYRTEETDYKEYEMSTPVSLDKNLSVTSEFPYSVLAKTMRKVILDYGESILVKPENKGNVALRQEICAYLRRSRGITVALNQVVLGAGAEYLYGLIAQLFPDARAFALEGPSYAKIQKVYEAQGKNCLFLPMYEDGIRKKDLMNTNADVLHVTPFNSFPSGVSISASKKQFYLEWARTNNKIIVEDNYDSELTVSSKPEDTLFSMDDSSRVIYINTFSRTIAPSIRMGYMLLPKDLVAVFEEKLGFYSCTVPLFEQYVLLELLKSGEYERHINRIRRKRRSFIADAKML